MSHKFHLSSELNKQIGELSSALIAEVADHQLAWDMRSERWQDSDAGTETQAWIENLQEVSDLLENFPEKPDV